MRGKGELETRSFLEKGRHRKKNGRLRLMVMKKREVTRRVVAGKEILNHERESARKDGCDKRWLQGRVVTRKADYQEGRLR